MQEALPVCRTALQTLRLSALAMSRCGSGCIGLCTMFSEAMCADLLMCADRTAHSGAACSLTSVPGHLLCSCSYSHSQPCIMDTVLQPAFTADCPAARCRLFELNMRQRFAVVLGPRPCDSVHFGPSDVTAGAEWDQRKKQADFNVERNLENERLRQARNCLAETRVVTRLFNRDIFCAAGGHFP